MPRLALPAALLLTAATAAAQPAPDRPANLQPTRDVAITYRVTGAEQGEMRIRYSAAVEAIRTDFTGFGPPGPVIADIRGRRMVMLVESERTARIRLLSEPEIRTFRQPEPGTRFARQGTERIAGLPCTVWRITPAAPGAPPVTICLTEDGAMLRTEESGHRAEATEITYAPQDPALFRIPQGWQLRRE